MDSVGAYAIEGEDGRLFLVLLNKHTAGVTVNATLAGGGDRAVALHRFTAGTPWGPVGAANVVAGALSLPLPARSATLAVIAPSTTAAGAAPGTSTFALLCAPNPVKEAGAVSFTLPRAGEAELALYDLAGRRLRTLARGPREAGPQVVRWDGRDERGRPVPAGVYWCRLTAFDRVETLRILRVR